ncbi:MAG: Hsp20/alpha crystallin family protein [Armatimonadetes bacterium]|nr:Hsp20/alpha crystallin family protein [Armatimonadota bacterium]
MALTIWEPMAANGGRRLASALDRLLSERPGASWEATMDVLETEEELTVKLSLPGCSKEAFDISFKREILTIKAEVPQDTQERARYLLRERFHGTVERSIRLPFEVNVEKAEARYQDGVLTLKLPKADTARPRAIKVQ